MQVREIIELIKVSPPFECHCPVYRG